MMAMMVRNVLVAPVKAVVDSRPTCSHHGAYGVFWKLPGHLSTGLHQ